MRNAVNRPDTERRAGRGTLNAVLAALAGTGLMGTGLMGTGLMGAGLRGAGAAHAEAIQAELPKPASTAIPRPQALEPDVQFWIRVYTEIDTNAGFLHDQYDLRVIYETLHFEPGSSPRERERQVDRARDRIVAALRRIAAAGDGPLSPEDQRIRDLWGDRASPRRLHDAVDDVRFQLGQSDRFRAGLVRAGAWETHIAETLANLGLPAELAVLPHVESSFNPAAYSKVGAAGLWQFMRSTGRRYMRIDTAVDDRLDPFRSTEGAAQLLAYNYRLLGTWPLAITAYNHGAAGVRHARESLGTDDIVQIVRHYDGRSFGFASRNFYVSFLAALEVDRNPEKYFGALNKLNEARFQEVMLPAYVPVSALARTVKVDRETLRALNPGLLRPVWEGRRRVPRGYRLRLPLDGGNWTPTLLAQRLQRGELYAAQTTPERYRVHRGDTLARVADSFGLSAEALAHANHLQAGARLKPGRSLVIPDAGPLSADAVLASLRNAPAGGVVPVSLTAAARPAASAAPGAVAAVAATGAPAAATVAGLADEGNAPSPAPANGTEATVVGRGESLADIAARTGTTEPQLLALNGIPSEDFLFEGQQIVVRDEPETPAAAAAAAAFAARKGSSAAGTGGAAGGGSAGAGPGGTAPATDSAPGATPVAGAAYGTAAGSAAALVPDLAMAAPPPVAAEGGAVTSAEAQRESAEDATAEREVAATVENAQPVSAAQAEAISPALGPAAATEQSADPTDYGVAEDGSIRVAAAETLGHYAEWLGVAPARLRKLNHLAHGRTLLIGQRLRLDLGHTKREHFEQRRRAYHRTLQADYFSAHRITGSRIYIARRGDSLWTITQHFDDVPVWLMQQYNPDVDLGDLRRGTQIVLPQVEQVAAVSH